MLALHVARSLISETSVAIHRSVEALATLILGCRKSTIRQSIAGDSLPSRQQATQRQLHSPANRALYVLYAHVVPVSFRARKSEVI